MAIEPFGLVWQVRCQKTPHQCCSRLSFGMQAEVAEQCLKADQNICTLSLFTDGFDMQSSSLAFLVVFSMAFC